MTTAEPEQPTTLSSPDMSQPQAPPSSPARAFLDRLAATMPTIHHDTNYLSLAIGYTRQAAQPAMQQWSAWTAGQRLIAACILLPLIAGPVMTCALFAPLVVAVVGGGYVAVFGVDRSEEHFRQAIKEHFGQPALSVEAFKKHAEGLKQQAKGSQFVQSGMHYASVGVGQLLLLIVVMLDYLIAGLVRASQLATQQRQNVADYKQKLDSPPTDPNQSTHSGKRKYKPVAVEN